MENEHIGPYTIERHLGSGGMGVVYLAYDERLRRRVAVKSIHPGKEVSPQRRERLVREARAAAGLSHPAVARVYDILTEDDRDYIVMEYVDGRSLTALLTKSPLELADAVDIGRQIAEGLQAAHEHGIVHRDLKSENIIITASGQVKILDFGLAKRLDPDAGEDSLTQDGVVMGTSRAMSPEQAQGLEIDHRSDLFSLGSLLYEMVTGRHPFQGSSPLDTMQRVVRHRPLFADRVNSDVPEELSLLIENLLEKAPDKRPTSALEVALALKELSGLWNTTTSGHRSLSRLTLAARRRRTLRHRWLLAAAAVPLVAALAALGWWQLHKPQPPQVVAVLAPQVSHVDDADRAALLAGAARTAVLETVAGLRGLTAPATSEVDAAGGDPAAAARITGASELIATTLDERGSTAQVTLQRLAGAGGKVLWSSAFTVPADDLALLADAVRAHLLRGYPDLEPRRHGRARPPSPEALAEYVRLRRQLESPPPGVTRKQTLEALEALRAANPRFLLPYLTEAKIARYLFITDNNDTLRDRARELLGRARDLAPGDPRVAAGEASLELAAGDLDAAATAVGRLEGLAPGSPDALRYRAALLRKQGKTEEAFRLLERMVAAYPSVASIWELAEAELHGGRPDAARRHLKRGLKLDPTRRRLRSKLAQLETLNGDPAEGERLYAELARDFHSPLYYSNLGVARLLQGRIEEALQGYQAALAIRENPLDVMSIGDCQLLLGQKDQAIRSYKRALKLANSLAQSDPVTYFGIRAQSLAHLGRTREAIQAIQEELQRAPKEPTVYFDAALAYAVIGDRTTAVVHAERAVQLGLNPRWLELPFFDQLRGDASFDNLLGVKESSATGE